MVGIDAVLLAQRIWKLYRSLSITPTPVESRSKGTAGSSSRRAALGKLLISEPAAFHTDFAYSGYSEKPLHHQHQLSKRSVGRLWGDTCASKLPWAERSLVSWVFFFWGGDPSCPPPLHGQSGHTLPRQSGSKAAAGAAPLDTGSAAHPAGPESPHTPPARPSPRHRHRLRAPAGAAHGGQTRTASPTAPSAPHRQPHRPLSPAPPAPPRRPLRALRRPRCEGMRCRLRLSAGSPRSAGIPRGEQGAGEEQRGPLSPARRGGDGTYCILAAVVALPVCARRDASKSSFIAASPARPAGSRRLLHLPAAPRSPETAPAHPAQVAPSPPRGARSEGTSTETNGPGARRFGSLPSTSTSTSD